MRHDLNCFFIVGAPRAGTTAMTRYLKKHAHVCFSDPKETHFFLLAEAREPPAEQRRRFLDAFYPDIPPQTLILGEGSVSTLYSPETIERMLAAFPAAKFIVMLRDPVELLRSYHQRLVFLRQEDEEDFEAAWNLQDARERGERIPERCHEPRILQYREVGRLGHYTAELFRLAGRERCLPVLFDDLTSHTRATYLRTLEFLDLPDDGRTNFKKVNQRLGYRSTMFQNLYAGPLVRPVAMLLKRDPTLLARIQRLTRPLRKRLKKINAVTVAETPLDANFVASLRREFGPDIEALGRLLGRDLSHWTAPQTLLPRPDFGRDTPAQRA